MVINIWIFMYRYVIYEIFCHLNIGPNVDTVVATPRSLGPRPHGTSAPHFRDASLSRDRGDAPELVPELFCSVMLRSSSAAPLLASAAWRRTLFRTRSQNYINKYIQ